MTKHFRLLQSEAASTAAALRSTTAPAHHARVASKGSVTMADIVAMIEDGQIEYSDFNRRKVLGSIRRCPEFYNAPLDQITADEALFRTKWGKGRSDNFPPGKFRDAKAFRSWRSNVAGALGRAAALTVPALPAPHPDVAAAWDLYLSEIADATGSTRKGDVFDQQSFGSYKRAAEIGRAAGVAPLDMTIEIFAAARDAGVTNRDKSAIARAAKRHDALRMLPAFAHIAPAAPTAPLPRVQRDRSESVATLRPHVRDAWENWLAALPLHLAPFTGEVIPISEGLMREYRAAFSWYVDGLARLGLVDLATLDNLQDLCRVDWVKKVVETGVNDPQPGLNKSTMGKYCRKLKVLFEENGVHLPKDRNLRQSTGMALPRQEWCKALIRSPRLPEVFFQAPKLLRRRAEAALGKGRTNDAIRAGAIAVSMSLLIYVAPLRAGNTVDLSLTGPDATLHLERGAEAGLLLVPGDRTKNGKPVEAPFPDERGPYSPKGMMDWFRQTIRPLMLERAGVESAPWLFPGKSAEGTFSYASYLAWFRAEMAAIGLPMTPHQVRHGVATLMLNDDPSGLVDIAAYLGDEPGTVLKHYAFIDRLKAHVNAQRRVLDGLRRLSRRSEGRI